MKEIIAADSNNSSTALLWIRKIQEITSSLYSRIYFSVMNITKDYDFNACRWYAGYNIDIVYTSLKSYLFVCLFKSSF